MHARRIEEAALNAWPAQQHLLYDGWILRFSQGYTRRANSVNPVYASRIALDEKIATCEARYAERGLPPVFRLPSWAGVDALDRALAGQGYAVEAPTLVLALDLAARRTPSLPPGTLRELALDPWLDAFCRLRGTTLDRHQAHRAILAAIPGRCWPVTFADPSGAVVACGLGVQEGDLIGLFDILTDPAQRGQGYATALIAGLLDRAQADGARASYLSVEEDNAPARHVYAAKLGYEHVYAYHYRVPGD